MEGVERLVDELKLPQLSDALADAIPRIEQRYEREVRSYLPELDRLTFQEVLDHLGSTLREMVIVLRDASRAAELSMLANASEHGSTRFEQDLNVHELLTEYAILRRVVVQEVRASLGRDLTNDEVLGLTLGCDLIARKTISQFVGFQRVQITSYVEAQAKQLSFLSHDLRGSLNGILLMLEVLRRDLIRHPELQESLEDLDMMRRSILETVTTMDRFLYAERFRRGKVVLKPMKIELSQVVNEVITQFSYQAKDKDLELKSELEENQWPIFSDRAMISIILQNLIGNAIKYTRKGSVRVLAQRNSNNTVRLTVADTGFGIAPEKLANLFTPYNRGETHGTEGSGLGLSIARQAAELMKSRLWAESEPGKGSQFHLELHDLPKPAPAQ